MIKGTLGVNETLQYNIISAGSYLFYLLYLYYWWEIFNGEDIKDVSSLITMNLQIGLNMATAMISIFVIMLVILFFGRRYNLNVYEAQMIYLTTNNLPSIREPEMFLPEYIFYVYIFIFAFISTIFLSFIFSHFIVLSFDEKRLDDVKYVYVCSKLLMIVNLIMFVLFFEFLKPSKKLYY